MDKSGYNTKQRDEILDFFNKHRGDCFTAKDIIRSGEVSVGEATVYRTLNRLAGQGLLKKFTDGEAGACYRLEASEECKTHFHLKCERCQKLIHMNCEFMADMKRHIEGTHDFTVDIGKTVIYGICGDCERALRDKGEP